MYLDRSAKNLLFNYKIGFNHYRGRGFPFYLIYSSDPHIAPDSCVGSV